MRAGGVEPIEFAGLPGSLYSMKMLAYLRFRHLPYQFMQETPEALQQRGYPVARPVLLPMFFLRDATSGARVARTDSTPLIRQFEAQDEHRSALPPDPALGFVADLIEDYADEWMTKMMFHYRWAHADNAAFVDEPLAYSMAPQMPGDTARAAAAQFARRQIDRLRYVGSTEATGPLIEGSYARVLSILDDLLGAQPFVLGARPSVADFAIYGQLSQLVRVDPVPMRICRERAPRLLAWVDRVADLSGQEVAPGGWPGLEDLLPALGPLLHEIGRTYAPYALANHQAHGAGAQSFARRIDGQIWEQQVFGYQAKCLTVLRAAFAELDDVDRQRVLSALEGTGCTVMCVALTGG